MSSRLTLFDNPLFLGFDEIEKTIDRMRKAGSDGYPPYNIEQIGDTGLCITLALAGFSAEDLDIEIENNQLTIRGQKPDEDPEKVFLYRGIAARRFQRSFVLAEGIEVQDADLDNGLLHINLVRIAPEPTAQKIEIKSAAKSGKKMKAVDLELNDKNE